MKSLLLVLAVVLVGCGKSLEEKVAGAYEATVKGITIKVVFYEDKRAEFFKNGVKHKDVGTWKIIEGKVRVIDEDGDGGILRIETNGDLTPLLHQSFGRKLRPAFLSGTDSKFEQELQEEMNAMKSAFTYKKIK